MRSQLQYQKNEQFQERWDDSHSLIYHTIPVCRHLISIALWYHTECVCSICTNAKVTGFITFCTFVITLSMIPYFIIPSTFSPQASSPMERYRQTEGRTEFSTPCSLSYFFVTECAGPYPQAQLYWAGRTMGWMAIWTRNMEFPCRDITSPLAVPFLAHLWHTSNGWQNLPPSNACRHRMHMEHTLLRVKDS